MPDRIARQEPRSPEHLARKDKGIPNATGDSYHPRKHPTHGVIEVPGQPLIVFGTVCTDRRETWLDNRAVFNALIQVWRSATAWMMGRFVIMPEHIHFFATPGSAPTPFDNWVRYWKSMFTKRHKIIGHRWQADHWDTRMRNAQQYEEKWE